MRPLLALVIALTLTGCWRQWESEYDQRWIEMADHEDDPSLTTISLRVQPEVVVGGRPVNILLEFAVRL